MEVIERLTSLCPPYLHLFVGDKRKLNQLIKHLSQDGPQLLVKLIEGAQCPTRDALFEQLAAVMEFPDYFGSTWDSLNECLNDLSWLPAQAYILIIKDFNKLLIAQNEAKKILVDILVKTAHAWASGQQNGALVRPPTAFHSILQTAQQENEIVRLLKEAQLKECNEKHND